MRRKTMELVFEGMLAVAYICAGTACAGITISKAIDHDREIMKDETTDPTGHDSGSA